MRPHEWNGLDLICRRCRTAAMDVAVGASGMDCDEELDRTLHGVQDVQNRRAFATDLSSLGDHHEDVVEMPKRVLLRHFLDRPLAPFRAHDITQVSDEYVRVKPAI